MKKVISVLLTLLIPIAMGIYGYLGYYYAVSQVDQTYVLFLIGGVLCISLFQLMNQSVQWKKDGNISWNNTLLSLVLVAFMAINSCTYLNMLPFPVKETVPNFYNTSVNKVNEWAERHQIEITTIYECSDTIPMYNVMAQDVAEGTITETVRTMQIVLSEGPNYDKDVIVPQMLGYTLDEILTYIQSHYMNNVEIRFEESPEERYIVIEQSKYGQMQRNDAITFTFSIGDKATLPEQTMENLVGLSFFEATLWLNKSGIPYTVTSEFSNDVERNYVLSQSVAVNDPVNTQSKVELTISKGKEITVPDLTKMTVEEVTAWVIDNKLTISFQDQYDDKVELGGIIKTNLKENDIIEEETPVKVTTSKGPLRMEEFKTLSAFKLWAEEYGVKYSTEREYSTTVNRGSIIKFSYKTGEIIKNGDSITVTISKGKPVTIPNFIGKSKSEIQSTCNSLNISCVFVYGSYSNSVKKNVATGQSVNAGKEVEQGTSVTITLSLGKAQSFTLYIPSSILGSSYNSTKSSLTKYFEENYPGVTFKFVAKSHNSLRSGQIHPDSPTKPGSPKEVTQGKTYTIWIVK